jgi:hypothetical protein
MFRFFCISFGTQLPDALTMLEASDLAGLQRHPFMVAQGKRCDKSLVATMAFGTEPPARNRHI